MLLNCIFLASAFALLTVAAQGPGLDPSLQPGRKWRLGTQIPARVLGKKSNGERIGYQSVTFSHVSRRYADCHSRASTPP